jgi:hypothetical protein
MLEPGKYNAKCTSAAAEIINEKLVLRLGFDVPNIGRDDYVIWYGSSAAAEEMAAKVVEICGITQCGDEFDCSSCKTVEIVVEIDDKKPEYTKIRYVNSLDRKAGEAAPQDAKRAMFARLFVGRPKSNDPISF